MLTHRGYSAWIECDGQPISEYLVAQDEHKVSCWIPGTPGRTFTVFWQDHDGRVDSCTFITLDGIVVPGKFLYGNGVAARSGIRVSRTSERPFVFQSVSEEAVGDLSTTSAKDTGMITLSIKRITRVASRYANALQPLPDSKAVLGKRKVGDLYVGFGEEQVGLNQSQTTWHVAPWPYNRDAPPNAKPTTYVSFVFRYRTLDFLENQGIATEANRCTQPVTLPLQVIGAFPPPAPVVPDSEDIPVRVPKKARVASHNSSAEASTSRIPSGPVATSSAVAAATPPVCAATLMTPSTAMMAAPAMASNSGASSQYYFLYDSKMATQFAPSDPTTPGTSSMDSTSKVPAKPATSPAAFKARAPSKPRVTSKSRVPSTSLASTSRVVSASRIASTSARLFPTESRRPSAEMKRIPSWTGPTPDTVMFSGGYQGESQFFVQPFIGDHYLAVPDDSATSDSATPSPTN